MPNGHSKRSTALRNFFDHVTSHSEENIHTALCMVANTPTETNGVSATDMHVYSFGANDPDNLAQTMVMAIDTMIEDIPGFEKAWEDALRTKRLQFMLVQALSVVQQTKEQAAEAKGMEAAKPVVDALIEKLKGNPGAVPGPDTKQ